MKDSSTERGNAQAEPRNEKKDDIFDRLMKKPGLRVFEPFYRRNKSVLMYLFFGGLTFLVSIISFAICNVSLGINELIANIISWVLAVLFAYYTNRLWVFDAMPATRSEFVRQILSFFAGRLATLAVEELIIFIFITRMGFASMPVKVAAQVVVIVLNYVISKLIVFRKKNG